MSRRYGRKQRRAAREMIAERDQTIGHCRQALLHEGVRSGELEGRVEFLLESIRLISKRCSVLCAGLMRYIWSACADSSRCAS